MSPIKLKHRQVKMVLLTLVANQNNTCELCGHQFTRRDGPVLDHCHITGRIRGAIHRSCNGAEGRVRARAHWGHSGVTSTEFLISLGKYLEKYYVNPRHLIHPSKK